MEHALDFEHRRRKPMKRLSLVLITLALLADRIYDADVYTNTAIQMYSSGESSCSAEYDINGIMTHEVGHSSVSGATMYPSISACNTSARSLATDDVNAK